MMTKYRPGTALLLVLFLFVGCKTKSDEAAVTAEPSTAPAASMPAPVEMAPVPSTTAAETAAPTPSVSAAASSTPTVSATASKTTTSAKTAASAAAAYTGGDPCTHKTLHTAQVREACRTGGRPAAKALMKNMVSKAKATNPDIKCSSCHADMKSFELKDNALNDLKKLL